MSSEGKSMRCQQDACVGDSKFKVKLSVHAHAYAANHSNYCSRVGHYNWFNRVVLCSACTFWVIIKTISIVLRVQGIEKLLCTLGSIESFISCLC